MSNKKTIILADDHTILRDGLRSILNTQSDLEVIAEVDNGKDAIRMALALKPDLLLTDISMPKTNGTEAIRELKKRLPEIKTLVLTMHTSEEHIHAALNAGASG
ncbi:MAG: response regulator transcription factor, partial [Gammaproteobacteria bacterium]|nr:response regulator transcription factor [Gammaproteobacteria bacterium]